MLQQLREEHKKAQLQIEKLKEAISVIQGLVTTSSEISGNGTFATRLAASGVSDTIIDQLLGHSRRDVLRFYTARVLEYLRDAMLRLDQLRTAKTAPSMPSRIDDIDERPGKRSIVVN